MIKGSLLLSTPIVKHFQAKRNQVQSGFILARVVRVKNENGQKFTRKK